MENERDLIFVPKGVVIFREGEEGRTMYIIHNGKVRISRRGELIAILEKGDFFGDLGMLTGLPRVADAVAEEDCELVLVDESTFDGIIKTYPELSIRIMRKLASRLRGMYELMERAGKKAKEESKEEEEELPKGIRAWLELEPENAIFPLKKKVNFIGRKDLSSNFIPHVDLTSFDKKRFVSRRHARIIFKDGKFFIKEEVGVLNGTFLNNRRISTGFLYELKDGDKITLGRLSLLFRQESTSS